MTSTIHILNSSRIGEEELRAVGRTVGNIFQVSSTVGRAALDIKQAFDESRGQYNSGTLLSQLLDSGADDGAKRIAVVDVDLFIPVLTFIFGEAQFDGPTAIVSTYRLSNEFYGLPQDRTVLLARLAKEIIHELGHTFGLYHCRQFECVMRSSTYVEEIDLKSSQFCIACGNSLRETQHFTATKKKE